MLRLDRWGWGEDESEDEGEDEGVLPPLPQLLLNGSHDHVQHLVGVLLLGVDVPTMGPDPQILNWRFDYSLESGYNLAAGLKGYKQTAWSNFILTGT